MKIGIKAVCKDGAFLVRTKVQICVALSAGCNLELPVSRCIMFPEVFDLAINRLLG
jgi:hypothetical protein